MKIKASQRVKVSLVLKCFPTITVIFFLWMMSFLMMTFFSDILFWSQLSITLTFSSHKILIKESRVEKEYCAAIQIQIIQPFHLFVFFFGELRDNVFVSCRADPDQPGVERRVPQQLVANRPVQNAVKPPKVNKKVQRRGLVVKAEDYDQEVLYSGKNI